VKGLAPFLSMPKLKLIKNQKKVGKELLQFEQNQVANNYKWGVLFLKEGQTEDEMYTNVSGNAQFEEFLGFIGDKIELKDWNKFKGGLDVKKNTTGTHSVYTQFNDMEIMFHVAPMLPYYPNDKQQLERKRHLGNDIIVIIFKEATSPFQPEMLKSEFNNICVVITPIGREITGSDKTHYKLNIVCKEGVPPFGPSITYPAVFEKNDEFREFLLTKLINGERAALHGSPAFRNKLVSARRTNLEQIEKSFA